MSYAKNFARTNIPMILKKKTNQAESHLSRIHDMKKCLEKQKPCQTTLLLEIHLGNSTLFWEDTQQQCPKLIPMRQEPHLHRTIGVASISIGLVRRREERNGKLGKQRKPSQQNSLWKQPKPLRIFLEKEESITKRGETYLFGGNKKEGILCQGSLHNRSKTSSSGKKRTLE